MTARKRSAARTSAPTKAGATIHEHRLRNGMHVLIAERHLDPVVAVMLWYGVGSRNEREDEAGVSHFLEHMMFKGTRRFGKGEVDQITTELGGSNNAFTTPDHTAYWFELASDRWEAALEIEADRMQHLALDAKEFESEKAVVLEELAMGKDDPWRILSLQVQEALFVRHPYRRPVIGYEDVLQRLDVTAMRDYYRRFYHPGNATLVVCGDVAPGAALKSIRGYFGAIPKGADFQSADCFRPELDEPLGERRVTTTWDDPASRVCMAWPTARVGTDEDYALDVVTGIFSAGRLSRLHRRLVLERGLATSISANNDARVDGGSFWLFAECVQGGDPAELERAIDAEFEELRRDLVPAAELRHAKATLSAGDAYEGETVSDLAEHLGEYAVDTDWHLALEGAERRERIRAADIRRVARTFLTQERRVVGWSLPRTAGGPEAS